MKEITDQKIKDLSSSDEVASSSQNENHYQFCIKTILTARPASTDHSKCEQKFQMAIARITISKDSCAKFTLSSKAIPPAHHMFRMRHGLTRV